MKKSSKTIGKGFTLIELLVAMAITTIIITILVSITGLSLDTWNRSRSEIRASRQAKAMIDSMARDLESLVIRKGNNFEWLYAASDVTSGGPNGNASPNAANLIFFSAATDRYDGNIGDPVEDLGGDVSAIAYELAYTNPIGDITDPDVKFDTFVLYRKLVNPDQTFSSLLGQTDLESSFSSYAGSGNNAVDDNQNFICENVYQFTVTFHVAIIIPGNQPTDPSRKIVVPIAILPSSSGTPKEFKITGSGIDTDYTSTLATNPQLASGGVVSVEISLTVLSDFGLAQMGRRTFSTTKEKDEFIAENSYQFSKLVPVPGS